MPALPIKEVPVVASCDVCSYKEGKKRPAEYDAPTWPSGSWAYLCLTHYKTHAAPNAGKVAFKLKVAK